MDYFSLPAVITPAWILLGAIGVLFARKFLWAYLSICLLLAVLSWRSGIDQVREQRAQENRAKDFDERQRTLERQEQTIEAGQEELKEAQQQLNLGFAQLATFLKLPPNSPREMILERMHEMVPTKPAATAVVGTPTKKNPR
jgi:flagellar biosynthesis/type III secretory pathway M-ring protein FliF/YscJ